MPPQPLQRLFTAQGVSLAMSAQVPQVSFWKRGATGSWGKFVLLPLDFPFKSLKQCPFIFCAKDAIQTITLSTIWITHGVPAEKIAWVLVIKGLTRHQSIWNNLYFEGFNMDIAFQSKTTGFTQRKVSKGG